MVETIRRTAGGRSAAEIVERAGAIQRRHFENWIAETARAQNRTKTKKPLK